MPTFSPPVVPGPAPIGGRDHPLWRHYGNFDCGVSVWRDPTGTYHNVMTPYQGGAEYRSFNDGLLISHTFDDPNMSLANATEVYLGGSVYEVSEATANDLVAAGFQIGGHADSLELEWTDYALTSAPNNGWKGGDGMASVINSSGQTAWVFSDTLVGTVDANGFYIAGLPFRNSCVIMDAAGQITSQIYASGGTGQAFAHPSPTTHWYWPLEVGVNGAGIDDTRWIMCLEVQNIGPFGTVIGNTMLRVNAFVQVVETVNYDNDNGRFKVYSVYNDSTFHYITAIEQVLPDNIETIINTPRLFGVVSYTRLARVPIGQLNIIANWQFWDGDEWVSSMSSAARLRDVDYAEIEGETSITKSGSNYIMCAISFGSPAVRMYKASSPEGPWKLYHIASTHKAPQKGLDPPKGRRYGYYQPKFHEHLSPSANNLVMTYMRNTFNLLEDPGSTIKDLHVSIFTPNFIYVPTPS